MSLVFNDTTNFRGLVQIYEREIGVPRGTVSGNTNKLKEFTADANLALDAFIALAIQASGKWQYDDTNYTDFPVITTTLTPGRRDYSFTSDEGGNLTLDVHRVMILPSATATQYIDLTPRDMQSDKDIGGLVNASGNAGVPSIYDKTGNSVLLEPVPNYTVADGIKIFINREASYFTTTDASKRPGVPGIFHHYFAIHPAATYARQNGLDRAAQLFSQVLKIEADAKEYFAGRNRDERKRLEPAYQNNR